MMKKFFVTAILSVMAVCASAQIYVGGQAGVWRDGTNHVTTIDILPEIGYTLSENTAIGTVIGWQYAHKHEITNNLFKIAPYYRYGFFQSGPLSLFVDGGFGLGAGKTSYDGESGDAAVNFEIGFKPGIAFKVSEKCSLVAHIGMLGYMGGNDAYKDAARAMGLSAEGWGLKLDANTVNFGFYYTF